MGAEGLEKNKMLQRNIEKETQQKSNVVFFCRRAMRWDVYQNNRVAITVVLVFRLEQESIHYPLLRRFLE